MINLFDDSKVYGSEYVMFEGFPRPLNSEELQYFAEEGEIVQGSFHKSVKLHLRANEAHFMQFDLSREAEAVAVVGSKVNIHNLVFNAMYKSTDPDKKVCRRISFK